MLCCPSFSTREGTMGEFSRRDFVKISAAGATASALSTLESAPAEAQPRGAGEGGLHVPRPAADQKYDLLVQGGEVLDPSQGVRGKRDVAIFHGRISAVEAQIPADKAKAVIAAAGKLVCPASSICMCTFIPKARRQVFL